NRRFWPVLIVRFDLKALRRDRDQLWAEAAVREAEGESIRLAPELWPKAGMEQQQRLADDPFVAHLDNYLCAAAGRIKSADLPVILDLRGAQLAQEAGVRISEAMRRLGWKRPNKSGQLRFDGHKQAAWVKGDSRKRIKVDRDQYGLMVE